MGRTDKVILSVEARVLKRLREKNGLSMRRAGQLLGWSDSYISQIENGRERIPKGERLLRFLSVYGGITEKYFKQLCKDYEEDQTDEMVIQDLLPKLKPEQIKVIRTLCASFAGKEL
ncbi:MAG: helix-turn-helix domain-containing protein [Bdellovibrionales bacterium]|jgi:transcriptional regulator with XRE-family HTH domain|nr:helix-turn-helix domain-containing protein [Bdellovibrionales bacterium]